FDPNGDLRHHPHIHTDQVARQTLHWQWSDTIHPNTPTDAPLQTHRQTWPSRKFQSSYRADCRYLTPGTTVLIAHSGIFLRRPINPVIFLSLHFAPDDFPACTRRFLPMPLHTIRWPYPETQAKYPVQDAPSPDL